MNRMGTLHIHHKGPLHRHHPLTSPPQYIVSCWVPKEYNFSLWEKVDVIWVNILGGAVKAQDSLWQRQKAKEDTAPLPPSRKRIRVQTERLTPRCLF